MSDDEAAEVQRHADAMTEFPGGPIAYLDHIKAQGVQAAETAQEPPEAAPALFTVTPVETDDDGTPGLLIDRHHGRLFIPDDEVRDLVIALADHINPEKEQQ